MRSTVFFVAVATIAVTAPVTAKAEEKPLFDAFVGVLMPPALLSQSCEVMPLCILRDGVWGRDCMDLFYNSDGSGELAAKDDCDALEQAVESTVLYPVAGQPFCFVPEKLGTTYLVMNPMVSIIGKARPAKVAALESLCVVSNHKSPNHKMLTDAPPLSLEAIERLAREALREPISNLASSPLHEERTFAQRTTDSSRLEKLLEIQTWMFSVGSPQRDSISDDFEDSLEAAGYSPGEIKAILDSSTIDNVIGGLTQDDETQAQLDILIGVMTAYITGFERGAKGPPTNYNAGLLGNPDIEEQQTFRIGPERTAYWVEALLPYPKEAAPEEEFMPDYPMWSGRYVAVLEMAANGELRPLWEYAAVLDDPWSTKRHELLAVFDADQDGTSEFVVLETAHEYRGYCLYGLEGGTYQALSAARGAL